MQLKFIIDKNGNVIGMKELAQREAKGWAGTFKTAFKEWGDTGKQFLTENEQGLIPSPTDQHACAQSRNPIAMIFQG